MRASRRHGRGLGALSSILMVAATACGGGSLPSSTYCENNSCESATQYCGDRSCETSETCDTCVADCCPIAGYGGGCVAQEGTTAAVNLQPGRLLGTPQPITASYRIGTTGDGTCEFQLMNYMSSLNSPYIAGAPTFLFDGSMACGQCYLLQFQGRRAIIVAGDHCPTCAGFDLPQTASAMLSGTGSPRNYNAGDGLTYVPVACDWQGHALQYYFGPGSSNWNWYLQILWPTYPVTRVTALVHATGQSYTLTHDSVGRFHVGNNPGTGAITFTLEAQETAEVITDTITWDGTAGALVSGSGVNFHL